MAVAAVAVLPSHGVVYVSGRERRVNRQQLEHCEQGGAHVATMLAPLDLLEIALELRGPLDRAH